MTDIDEKLQPILTEVTRRNAGDQALHEVLESLCRVVATVMVGSAYCGRRKVVHLVPFWQHDWAMPTINSAPSAAVISR